MDFVSNLEGFGTHAVLVTENGLYGVVFVMCFLVGFVTKHRIYGHADAE
ncbi:hypothetical protein [Photobacterium leiognathi]|nr:hypothetical protein [Photobacterium leiognathi]